MMHLFGGRYVAVAFAVAASMVTVGILGADRARAGSWIRTSCVNPDGSPAPADGWSAFEVGAVSVGSTNKANCGPGDPMIAFLAAQGPAGHRAAEVLRYTPPAGSRLIGGKVMVGLSADGYGYRAAATAAMLTPEYAYDGTNVFLQCIAVIPAGACQNGQSNYYGVVDLPPEKGGELYVAAGCWSQIETTYCTNGANRGAWSIVGVEWARLVLSSDAAPTASDFRGSLLEPAAHGTAGLAFTAADAGPGVYKVTVAIDGTPVYDATPNANGGKCAPVGTDLASGALMWAWQQPCSQSQPVDIQVRTTTLRDGPHELTVAVVNPGGTAAVVMRRTITTDNRTTVSSKLTSDKVTSDTPASASAAPAAPDYAVELDAATQALVGGIRRRWSRSAVDLAGTVRRGDGGPAQGVLVTLFARRADQDASQAVAHVTTNVAGHWALVAPRGPSRVLSISLGEQPDPMSQRAIEVRQTVRPDVTLRLRALGGGRVRFSGRLRMEPLGSPRPRVVIQTFGARKRWKDIDGDLQVNASGAYSVTYDGGPSTVHGTYSFRTVTRPTRLFARGISAIRRIKVS